MSSNENLPSLLLSDIMHPMSPSPAPLEDQVPAPRQSRYDPDAQQEPLTSSEVLNIRNRLQELGVVMSYGSENEDLPTPRLGITNHLNLREKELTEMILRLTSCPEIDHAQLEEQASTILTLTTQRDYLIAKAEEERLILGSERENWDRTAEALLTQKTRPLKTEDLDAQRAAYEAEIKSLREKLHDRHRRLSALEQEILRLKPLLLMQPQRMKHTLVTQSQTMKILDKRREVDATPSNIVAGETPQKFDPTTYPYGYQYKPEVSTPSGQLSHDFSLEGSSALAPGSQRRRSKDHSNVQKSKKQKLHRSTTMSSDAYAEHVLLAAQRIGRKRAAQVSGLQRLADREKEGLTREYEVHHSRKEQERLENARLDRLTSGGPSMVYYRQSQNSSPHRDDVSMVGSTPTGSKTPKRGGYPFGHNANPGGVNTPPPSTFVFVNTSAPHPPRLPSAYSPGSVINTPSRMANPPTPLDSLVDAARMMGDTGDRGNSRRRLLEDPESPTAKRSKVANDKVLASRGAFKLGRVKSGLDVLADQAAAVNKPDQISLQPSANDHTTSDRKGKGKANVYSRDAEWDTPTKSRSFASASRRGTRRIQGVSRDTTSEPRVIALPTVVVSGPEVTRLGLNLRPVSGWGNRPPDENEEDSNSDSTCGSPTRLRMTRDQNALEVNNLLVTHPEREQVVPASVTLGSIPYDSDATPVNGQDEERNTQYIAGDSQDVTSKTIAQSRIRQTDGSESSQSQLPMEPDERSRQPSFGPIPAVQRGSGSEEYTADAGSDNDEDEDAEGEEDEENIENEEVSSRNHTSRSRSPPPPDPPGNDNGPGPSNDQDPDADADGDMDVDDKGTPPSETTSPAGHQTQGGHHQQTVIAPVSIFSVPVLFLNARCITASSKKLSSCMQSSRVSIQMVVYTVGNCAIPPTFRRETDKCCTVSKLARIVFSLTRDLPS